MPHPHPDLAFVATTAAAGLGLTIAAMFAMLVLSGLYLLIELLAGAFKPLPIIGPPVARGLNAAAYAMRDATLSLWHGTLWALEHTIKSVTAAFRNLGEANARAATAIIAALSHHALVTVPRQIAKTRTFASNEVSKLAVTVSRDGKLSASQLNTLRKTDQAYSRKQAQQAERNAAKALSVTSGQLFKLMQAGDSKLAQQIRAGEAAAAAQAQQLARQMAAGDKQATATAVHMASTAVDSQAKLAWAPLWTGIVTGVAGAIRVAGTDFPQITAQLQAIPTEAPATLAEAETAAAAAIPPMMTAIQDCVLPNCKDLSSLRSLMNTVTDVIFTALLLAWIIQMITDPVTWARENYDAFGPVIDGAMVVVNQLKAA